MSTPQHFITHVDQEASGPFELGTIQWLREFGAAGRPDLSAGYWFVSTEQAPETFPLTAAYDESFHLISGRLRIEFVGGETIEVGPGDSVSYNVGTEMLWTVVEDACKFFVYSGTAA